MMNVLVVIISENEFALPGGVSTTLYRIMLHPDLILNFNQSFITRRYDVSAQVSVVKSLQVTDIFFDVRVYHGVYYISFN